MVHITKLWITRSAPKVVVWSNWDLVTLESIILGCINFLFKISDVFDSVS